MNIDDLVLFLQEQRKEKGNVLVTIWNEATQDHLEIESLDDTIRDRIDININYM